MRRRSDRFADIVHLLRISAIAWRIRAGEGPCYCGLTAGMSVIFTLVCAPLGQGLSAQLLVEEGNGKPPHHHPSSNFPSLDDTGVSPLRVTRTCLTAEHLSSRRIQPLLLLLY